MGAPHPPLIFSPMNSRIHHASSGALDFGPVHAPYRIQKKDSIDDLHPTNRRNFAWQLTTAHSPRSNALFISLRLILSIPLAAVISPGVRHDQLSEFKKGKVVANLNTILATPSD